MSRRINKPDTKADIELRECLKSKTSFVVVAGAGSGKTTSLIKALKYIEDNEGQRMRQLGKRVACITYTTTAEKEILDDVGHDTLFHVSTIHSFLWELIRSFQPDIKRWVVSKINKKITELVHTKANFGSRVQQRTREKNEADTLRYQDMAEKIDKVNEFKYETGSNYMAGILGHSDIINIAPELITASPLLQSILVEKYPYFFIDESQDTNPSFIDAIKVVEKSTKNFCLGFFGDPMQKIYMTGAGAIGLESGWKQINKPENFRCATNVLNVINEIRKGGDALQQTGGRKINVGNAVQAVKGSAYLFVLQADDDREKKIGRVREYLADQNSDPLWLSDSKEADVRVLVMEHRMAAKRLEFEELFSVFNDDSSDSISTGFREGTHWSVQPFVKFTIPLLSAIKNDEQFEVIELLRRFSPRLSRSKLQMNEKSPREILSELKHAVNALAYKFENTPIEVGNLLTFIRDEQLMILDERIAKWLDGEEPIALEEEESSTIKNVMERYFKTSARQMHGYQKYINEESVYSTQHSVKGAEFERVMVVLDDEEGNSNFYSYDKLFGISPLSERDAQNIAAGTDNTPARTRRLFYVCCSRALKDLTVIIFASNPEHAKQMIEASTFFPKSCIKDEADFIKV